MTTIDKSRDKRRRYIALLVGVVLALICRSLPHEYQGPCETLASVCRGGL